MVELLVAMVLIGIAATGFTLATLGLARGSKRLGWATTRNAALLAESNRLATTPFAALPTVTGCTSVPATANAFAYERCIQLTTVSAAERHLRVTVTPTVPGVRPETLVVRRADIAVPPPC
jgi:hypothetical protein